MQGTVDDRAPLTGRICRSTARHCSRRARERNPTLGREGKVGRCGCIVVDIVVCQPTIEGTMGSLVYDRRKGRIVLRRCAGICGSPLVILDGESEVFVLCRSNGYIIGVLRHYRRGRSRNRHAVVLVGARRGECAATSRCARWLRRPLRGRDTISRPIVCNPSTIGKSKVCGIANCNSRRDRNGVYECSVSIVNLELPSYRCRTPRGRDGSHRVLPGAYPSCNKNANIGGRPELMPAAHYAVAMQCTSPNLNCVPYIFCSHYDK